MARDSMQHTEHDRETSIGSTAEKGRPARTSILGGLGRRPGAPADRTRSDSQLARMQRLADDMDLLLDGFGFGRTPSIGLGFPEQASWSPQVEIFQRGDRLVVRADVPGLKKEDLHVDLDDGVLTVRGERREERTENEKGYYRSERHYGEFYRAIPLPDGIDADRCEAQYQDGVLEVTVPMPKQEQRKAKPIRIR